MAVASAQIICGALMMVIPGTAPHPLYGDVNTYPAEVLDMAFDIA